MKAYKVKKKVSSNGGLLLEALPFGEGELVEVIILATKREEKPIKPLSLKGSVMEYTDPIEPVAEQDWEALG
jgi:hypothetical protein